MKTILNLLYLFLFVASTYSQQKYATGITIKDIKAIVNVLAHDSLQGREAGSKHGRIAGQFIADNYDKYGLLRAVGDKGKSYFQKIPIRGGKHTYNIAGYVEGSEFPEEVIVITAHYDHIGVRRGQIYNGADDNASGTAALMEVGEAFAQAVKDGKPPKRSVLLLALGAEEKGLVGSAYYADKEPLFPLKNTVVNLNMDMVGHLDDLHPEDPNFVSIVGSDWQSTELHEIHEKANADYVRLELDYTYNSKDHPERFFYRSDQYNFAKYAIPVIFYTSGDHQDYHKPTDTIDRLEFDRIEKVAKLVFYTAWEVANRDKRIIVDKPLK